MSKVAIVTDSNSGITQAQAKELGIRVMPMPFYINEEMLLEDIDLTQEQFYERLTEGADIHTSTPILTDFTELWDELLKEYDEIVHIPMSSGLSSTCSTAAMLAQDYEGKVFVVDNQRISVTQRQSVMDAMELAAAGKSGQEIYDKLMENKMESSIYIMLDTLYYLKKGGRITPAAAALGTLLKLKPVLQIQGEKLDAFAKARTVKQAKNIMIKQIKNIKSIGCPIMERLCLYRLLPAFFISCLFRRKNTGQRQFLAKLRQITFGFCLTQLNEYAFKIIKLDTSLSDLFSQYLFRSFGLGIEFEIFLRILLRRQPNIKRYFYFRTVFIVVVDNLCLVHAFFELIKVCCNQFTRAFVFFTVMGAG